MIKPWPSSLYTYNRNVRWSFWQLTRRGIALKRRFVFGAWIDKAPRPSISNVIGILSSDTTCQLKQLFSNSEGAMLSKRGWQFNMAKKNTEMFERKKTSKYAQQLHRDRRGNHQVCFLHHSLSDLPAPVVFLKEIVVGLFLKFLISKVILPASPDNPFTQCVFKISQLLKESSVRADRAVLTDQLKSLGWLLSWQLMRRKQWE